jgi:hypothetical protein
MIKLLVSDGFSGKRADTTGCTVGKPGGLFSDPDMLAHCFFTNFGDGFPKTSIFLYGGERLFFLTLRKPGNY